MSVATAKKCAAWPSDEIRGWMLLAAGALALAGGLALLLALSRAPGIGPLLPWGPDFFYRALVTHVVLAFQVWFLAVLGMLAAMAAPGAHAGLERAGLTLATLGVAVLLVPALADRGEPSLNNYIPVIRHPLFFLGLGLHSGGVALACLGRLPRLLRARDPARFGTGVAALALLSAQLCVALAWVAIPAGTDPDFATERLFWGGGHVLQIVNTALLMVAWQRLAERQWGQGPLPAAAARACFAILGLFALAAPLVYLRTDVLSLEHRTAFTGLLWWGLPLPPLLMGLGVARLCLRGPWQPGSAAFVAPVLSVLVFAVGGLAGYGLGVADTRTPSHYHAMIGGVMLALMGLFPLSGRRAVVALHLYGWGQLVHAAGFFLAGAAGVPRKTAGAAQGLDSAVKVAAMLVVNLGAAAAVAGGVLFVWGVLRHALRRATDNGDT